MSNLKFFFKIYIFFIYQLNKHDDTLSNIKQLYIFIYIKINDYNINMQYIIYTLPLQFWAE